MSSKNSSKGSKVNDLMYPVAKLGDSRVDAGLQGHSAANAWSI